MTDDVTADMTEDNALLDAFERPIVPGAVVVYATTSSRSAIVKYGIVRAIRPPRETKGSYGIEVYHGWEVVVDGISSCSRHEYPEPFTYSDGSVARNWGSKFDPSTAIGVTIHDYERESDFEGPQTSRSISWLELKPRTITRLDNLVVIPGVDREFISSHPDRFKEWGHREQQLKGLK